MTKLIAVPSKIIPGLSRGGSSNSSSSSIKKRLRAIADLPTNRICSDCPEPDPSWASLQIMDDSDDLRSTRKMVGVLCCYQCCSHHFQLGKEICIVKNIKMVDEWTITEVEALERGGGNDIVNWIWEAGLSSAVYDKMTVLEDADVDAVKRKEFIRLKYQELRYFDRELYKTQIPDDQDQDLDSSEKMMKMPLVGRIKPTKNKPSKRAKSFDSTSIRHQNLGILPRRRSSKKNRKGPLRRSATFGGQRDSSSSSDSDDDDDNNNKQEQHHSRNEMEDDSSRRFGYSLPSSLGVQQQPTTRSSKSSFSKAAALSSLGSKKKQQRGPSAERKRRGSSSSSSSSSKYMSIQDSSTNPSKEDLGYGSDSSRGSNGYGGGGGATNNDGILLDASLGGSSCRSSTSHSSNTSRSGVRSRLPRRERRRSSSASSSNKYMAMGADDSPPSLPSHDDLGYGSNSMDESMDSISGLIGAGGGVKPLPPRGGTTRRGSSRSNCTVSTAASSSLSNFGGSNSSDQQFGRWNESSHPLQNNSNSESWNMSQNSRIGSPTTTTTTAATANDRWSADSSSSSQDRWNNSSSSSLTSVRRSSSPANDRWCTESSSSSSTIQATHVNTTNTTTSTTSTTLNPSEATQKSETTLPRCVRRRSNSTGRPASAGMMTAVSSQNSNNSNNSNNNDNGAAPRMPSRVVSDCSGDEMGTGDENNLKDHQQRAPVDGSCSQSKQTLRRLSLPSFAGDCILTQTYADEDSIEHQYGGSTKLRAMSVGVRRRSLGMKKEKSGPKYGVKMGYGFDSSKESDSEQESSKSQKEEGEREKKPSGVLERSEEVALAPTSLIEAPALGQFLEKSQEALPNKVLGGRSLGSGTKSSDEYIMGIGAPKARTSWMDREKISNMVMGIEVEPEADATPQKRLSFRMAEPNDESVVGSLGSERGSLSDHLKNGNSLKGKGPNDLKSLSGLSAGISYFSGCSFGSNSSTSLSDESRPTQPPSAPTKRLEAALRVQRASLAAAASDAESSSLAASCFSRSSHESSVSSDEDMRRAFTLAILKASGQAA